MPPFILNALKKLCIFAVLLLVAFFPLRSWFFHSSLYPAPNYPVRSPTSFVEEVTFSTAEGDSVHAFWIPPLPEDDGKAVILHLHGNGENLGTLQDYGFLDTVKRLGHPVLIPDYPGYGRSTGKASEQNLQAAGQAALSWIRQKEPQRKVILFGWSLGSAVALAIAQDSNPGVDGLIVASPWTTLEEAAKVHFSPWIVRLGLMERWDSLKGAATYKGPALVIHGAEDRLIPVEQGARIAATLQGANSFLKVRSAGHNDLMGRPEPWEAIRSFLQEHG